ncbi:hypothetical protein I4F81_006608 [Pyropia yezoensis]|uniref:Uncharacterized protein n=1 Tax=Pyropia yezoensis TaxID=2788 RepID=A0ACC3C2H2_PYRYE|nr:hypothetical protein I4F81_006608 [Neopyropia yezoensis]
MVSFVGWASPHCSTSTVRLEAFRPLTCQTTPVCSLYARAAGRCRWAGVPSTSVLQHRAHLENATSYPSTSGGVAVVAARRRLAGGAWAHPWVPSVGLANFVVSRARTRSGWDKEPHALQRDIAVCKSTASTSPEPLDGYGWLNTSKVCHTHLCRAARRCQSRPAWRTGAEMPSGYQVCRLCASHGAGRPGIAAAPMTVENQALPRPRDGNLGASSLVDEDLALSALIRARGWARDVQVVPAADELFGSHPERLPVELLVSVEQLIQSAFESLAENIIPDLCRGQRARGRRQTGFYIRASPGIGKTFLFHEIWSWWLAHRTTDQPTSPAALLETLRTLGGRPSNMAAVSELFCVGFNGETAVSDTEISWGAEPTTPITLFENLRLCYNELVDPTAVDWSDFTDEVDRAFKAEQLSSSAVAAAAKRVIRYCRGRPTAFPILLVDELAKVDEIFTRDFPVPKGNNEPKLTGWSDAVRSQACLKMQFAGGTVLFTTLDEALMVAETRSSGRTMVQACLAGYRPALAYRKALEFGLSKLVNDPDVTYVAGKVLRVTPDNKSYPPSGFIDALALLLGGHSRFVNTFVRKMTDPQTSVRALVESEVRNKMNQPEGPVNIFMGDDVAEAIIGDKVCEAAIVCNLRPSISRYPNGVEGVLDVVAHVLLGREVTPSSVAAADQRGNGLTWDNVASRGLIGLLPRGEAVPVMLPWTLFALKKDFECPRAPTLRSALHDLLKFDGDRLTGRWMETFYTSWEVMISHARARFPETYSSISVASLLTSRSSGAYVGSGYLLRDVTINAAAPRRKGCTTGVLEDLLKISPSQAGMLDDVVFRLLSSNATPSAAVDAAVFHRVTQDFEVPDSDVVLAKDSAVAVVYQVKGTSADSKVPSSAADVRNSVASMRSVVGDANWEVWKDRVIFVLIDRRAGRVCSTNAKSTVDFRDSAMGRQSVLLTNEDLPGLFSTSLYDMFCVSEYLESGVVTNLDRIAGLKRTVTK